MKNTYIQNYNNFKTNIFDNKYIYLSVYNIKTQKYKVLFNYDDILSIILCYLGFYKPFKLDKLFPSEDEIMIYSYAQNNKINYRIGNNHVELQVIYAEYSNVDLSHEFEKFGYNPDMPGVLYAMILFLYKFGGNGYILDKTSNLKILVNNDTLVEQLINDNNVITI
jgi:hypothetical protein